eukprot:CAMPEP_0206211754 /NCGR_PEP_ID=MMETSP0047_2-20121206/169_1 /ASSEMBLY_ACC=CAM_ASM_000192 /TAXON_ID=195065 /ORGANISM="Chroomonas mesostigmatica_cf, Strain CCMP1168" /LENGTH=122 /DNA_ID=CAMNT_0053633681 /DNA_START=205 /DNA_END=573 /DNA_ORIENTATION=+
MMPATRATHEHTPMDVVRRAVGKISGVCVYVTAHSPAVLKLRSRLKNTMAVLLTNIAIPDTATAQQSEKPTSSFLLPTFSTRKAASAVPGIWNRTETNMAWYTPAESKPRTAKYVGPHTLYP